MDQIAEPVIRIARSEISDTKEPSESEVDGTSSLSEIEDKFVKEVQGTDLLENRDGGSIVNNTEDFSNLSDDENNSEAETERLEESPTKRRTLQDVALSSSQGSTHSQSSSNQQNIFKTKNLIVNEERERDVRICVSNSPHSPKIFVQYEEERDTSTARISQHNLVRISKKVTTNKSSVTRKRKRSMLGEIGLEESVEPLRFRNGSILMNCDGFQSMEKINIDEVSSNSAADNVSADEEVSQDDDSTQDTDEVVDVPDLNSKNPDFNGCLINANNDSMRFKKPESSIQEDDSENIVEQDSKMLRVDGNDCVIDLPANREEDDTEAVLRNEEAIEKRRIALNRLGDIERQFSTFRDRLYEERLKQLNDEDTMLRQPQPSHPEYLACMQCVDTRRDERIYIAEKQRIYKLQCLKKEAVALRSQILAQYQQEIRNIREKKLEQLGEQWYKIQNDRRSSAGIGPEFLLKFPTKRTQQLSNHIAYCNEVSILSGIAKYVGFPAAPIMAPASATELEEDLEKMGRLKQISQATVAVPLHELATLRAVSSYSKFKPEEQCIEQTSWANSEQSSNSYLIQRQAMSSLMPRTTSLSPQVQTQLRRQSFHQGRTSPGPLPNHLESQQTSVIKRTLSPLDSNGSQGHVPQISKQSSANRRTSISPNPSRALSNIPDPVHHLSKTQTIQSVKSSTLSPVAGVNIDYLRKSRLSA